MSFFDRIKSKAQETFQGQHKDNAATDSHNQHPTPPHHKLKFTKPHLQSQNASIPQPGKQAPGPGQLPPKVKSHVYHEPMTFLHPSGHAHNVMRDLGFSGVLDGRIVWTWGDTLMGTGDQSMICAVDSTTIGTLDAKGITMDSAIAPNSNNVRNWIDCLPEEEADGGLGKYAFGGTNIVEYPPKSGKGVVYYLKNSRPGGQSVIKGAGIASVHIDDENIPHSQRHGEILWNEYEAWYGDVGAILNEQDGYIYAFGHGPAWDPELNSRTFLARVPAKHATDISAYEYWKNADRTWTRQCQANGSFGTAKLEIRDAIFDWHVMNQAVPFWNVHFNRWMFVHGSSWPTSDVLCRTASTLEGPWEDHGSLCSAAPKGDEKGFRYCINAHPEYDSSGRTIYVTWTRENVIYGVTIEWE